MFRTNTTWASGMYYHSAANESMVFANKNPVTSWIFANTDPTTNTDWRNLTPSLQIKNGRVTINKLIADGTNAAYNLDVNGSANATELYENGIRVSLNGHTHYLGNKSASDLSSTYPKGISVGGIYSNGYPITYGSIITAYGSGGYFQIAGEWNSAVTGASNYDFPTEMYIRGRRDSFDVWTTWSRVLTDRNYNSYSPSLTGTGASGTWSINITGYSNHLASNSSKNIGGLSYYYISGSTFNTTVDGSWSGYTATTNYNSIIRLQSHTGTAKYYIDLIFDVNSSNVYYRRVTNNSLANIGKIDVYEVPESTATYSLSNAAWTNTISLPSTAGSYILNITSGNSTLTGVFSIGTNDNAKDEISLHLHGNGPRLYARTNGGTLQLSSSDTNATSRSVTIKYRRMI